MEYTRHKNMQTHCAEAMSKTMKTKRGNSMPYQLWINGRWTSGSSGKVIEVRDPATEEVIDTAPAANAADVDAAVSAAQAAFPAWKKLPAGQKAEMLHEVAQKLI